LEPGQAETIFLALVSGRAGEGKASVQVGLNVAGGIGSSAWSLAIEKQIRAEELHFCRAKREEFSEFWA